MPMYLCFMSQFLFDKYRNHIGSERIGSDRKKCKFYKLQYCFLTVLIYLQDFCEQQNGQLVEIQSDRENNFLKDELRKNNRKSKTLSFHFHKHIIVQTDPLHTCMFVCVIILNRSTYSVQICDAFLS